jgi:hypothetical protein
MDSGTRLKDYPTGTRIQIGKRTFVRTATGSFWREEHEVLGNRVSRPSVSLEGIERYSGLKHKLLEAKDEAC